MKERNCIPWWTYYGLLSKIDVRYRRTRCWFIGHDRKWDCSPDGHPDWCNRCFVDWPQDRMTLPNYLNMLYGWFVEREWEWFDRIDTWLRENKGNLLPSWWEY